MMLGKSIILYFREMIENLYGSREVGFKKESQRTLHKSRLDFHREEVIEKI